MSKDSEDTPDPVKPTSLQRLLRTYTPEEKQVGGDSADYLKSQIDNTIRAVWEEAIRKSWMAGVPGITIMEHSLMMI